MKTRAVVFSKDRAMQLHATLCSFALRCVDANDADVAVIYKASLPEYAEAYEELKNELGTRLRIKWIEETNFKMDLLGFIFGESRRHWLDVIMRRPQAAADEFLLFMVDDNVFVSDFLLARVCNALSGQPDALGFSLRVGKNTTYCYPNRCEQAPPQSIGLPGSILRFAWPKQQGDFGYPLEVSSSVYRVRDVEPLLRRLPYSNPNRLEQGLSVSSRLFVRSKPDLLCFEQSVAFCAPVNKVQSVLDNRAGENTGNSAEQLNRLFLSGMRIDTEALRGFVPTAAHQEIDLPLVRSAA